MTRRPRYSDWNPAGGSAIGGRGNTPVTQLPPDSVVSTPSAAANFSYLLAAMRSNAPGQWSQNLLELANHFTNAAFVAINTLAN